MKRAIYSSILFLSLFLAPWWLSVILAVAGLFIFVSYYEFLGASVCMYALYCAGSPTLISSPVWYSCGVAVIYGGVAVLRDRIIVYTHEI